MLDLLFIRTTIVIYKFSQTNVWLYLDRIDVSEGTDVNKTTAWRECIVYHYRYFLEKNFNFQSKVCDGCYNVLMIYINLHDILNICGVNYCCILNGISKRKSVNILCHTALMKKLGHFKTMKMKKKRNFFKYLITFGDIEKSQF